jgi:hypothetical protein
MKLYRVAKKLYYEFEGVKLYINPDNIEFKDLGNGDVKIIADPYLKDLDVVTVSCVSIIDAEGNSYGNTLPELMFGLGIKSNYTLNVDTNGTSLILAFKVEDQKKRPHFKFQWKTEKTGGITFYEAPIWTPGTGSILTPVNDLRNACIPSILQGDASGAFVSDQLVLNPTGFSAAGSNVVTLFEESVWSGDATPAATGTGGRSKLILDVGQTYAIQIAASNGGMWLHLDWFEQGVQL